MRRLINKYYRIVVFVVILVAIISVVIIVHKKNTRFNFPDVEYVYDNNYLDFESCEMQDYIVTRELEGDQIVYYLTDKTSGVKRKFFNDPFDTGFKEMKGVKAYKNKVYYHMLNGFYCYDADFDYTTEIYSVIHRPFKVEVFDVVVYYRTLTREEWETSVKNYVICKDELIIITNVDIRSFDGKDTETLIRGEYIFDGYENGILKLHSVYLNSEGESTRVHYEYDLESRILNRIKQEEIAMR